MVTRNDKYRILCSRRGLKAVEEIVQCFVIIAESRKILIQNLTIMFCKTLLTIERIGQRREC